MSAMDVACNTFSLPDTIVMSREHMKSTSMSVSVLQPLTVNTNIEYELDWSRFPGLVETQSEPILTIHPDYSWPERQAGESAGNDDSILELLDSLPDADDGLWSLPTLDVDALLPSPTPVADDNSDLSLDTSLSLDSGLDSPRTVITRDTENARKLELEDFTQSTSSTMRITDDCSEWSLDTSLPLDSVLDFHNSERGTKRRQESELDDFTLREAKRSRCGDGTTVVLSSSDFMLLRSSC